MFSDFYFYLIAWLADDNKDSYTVFRVDRITEVVSTNKDGSTLITAETYGDGIDMWLRSQGEWVEVVE